MTKVTIKVPVTTKQKVEKLIDATGQVVYFKIAGKRTKCIIQELGIVRHCQLTHFASGKTMVPSATITSMKIRYLNGGKTLTTRAACELCLMELVQRTGADKVRSIIENAEVINV